MKTVAIVVAVGLLMFLTACTINNPQVSSKEVPNQKESVPLLTNWQIPELMIQNVESVDDIFDLSDIQKQEFIDYYNLPENQDIKPDIRLANYLENLLSKFNYKGETYTATEALENQSGNCLSLAIVTSALAELTDLHLKYQKIVDAPIYRRHEEVMTVSSHVRTHVYSKKTEKSKDKILFSRSKSIIDYFPGGRSLAGNFVGEKDFLSMFYQNKAAAELVNQNYTLSYSYLVNAMDIDSLNVATLNSLAVLHRKLGNIKKAEMIYQYALDNTSGSVNLYENYVTLLEETNQQDKAKDLISKLPDLKDDNPYNWISIGDRALINGNYSLAIQQYKRAIELAPYLHEGYFGLAQTYYKTNQQVKAIEAMKKSVELAFTPTEEALYLAKLHKFKQ